MKLHRWSEIKNKNRSPEQIKELEEKIEQELLEMSLKELRQEFQLTQTELSQLSKIEQSEISRVEQRQDHRLSTLRRYVEALGGELEVFAVLHQKRVRLKEV